MVMTSAPPAKLAVDPFVTLRAVVSPPQKSRFVPPWSKMPTQTISEAELQSPDAAAQAIAFTLEVWPLDPVEVAVVSSCVLFHSVAPTATPDLSAYPPPVTSV